MRWSADPALVRYRLPSRYVRRNPQPCDRPEAALVPAAAAAPTPRFASTPPIQPEFDRWRWVDYWQPLREVIFFKRPVYMQTLRELGAAGIPPGTAALAGLVARKQPRNAIARAAPTAL